MPRRRTFATAILAFAHSMLTALRHPASACQQRRLSGPGHPLPVLVLAEAGVPAGGVPWLVVGEFEAVADHRPHRAEIDRAVVRDELHE